jgi:class I lanthipeptide synthase
MTTQCKQPEARNGVPTWGLRSAHAERAQLFAAEVVRRVQRQTRSQEDVSLAEGNAGFAVLLGYLDRCFPNEGWDKVAHETIQRVSKNLGSLPSTRIGLFGGFAGVAFAFWYLSRDDTRYRRARSAIEDVLLPQALLSANALWKRSGMAVEEFDVITGLTGVAAYLLCRTSDSRAYAVLERIIQVLVELLDPEAPVPNWFTPGERITSKYMMGKFPDGNLNCGLAHGMPGVLSVLALAWAQGIRVPGLREAISHSAGWLIAQRRPDRWGYSWPAAVPVGTSATPAPAPLGWCYGNPGIACTLWLAGSALDDSFLRESAIEALRSVHRRGPHRHRGPQFPQSLMFCHGQAGLVHITMRLASETGLPEFFDAADQGLEQLVSSFSEESVFGYRAYDPEDGLVDRAGLLDGAEGVALVLLAASSDQEPTWDRVFLLS